MSNVLVKKLTQKLNNVAQRADTLDLNEHFPYLLMERYGKCSFRKRFAEFLELVRDSWSLVGPMSSPRDDLIFPTGLTSIINRVPDIFLGCSGTSTSGC